MATKMLRMINGDNTLYPYTDALFERGDMVIVSSSAVGDPVKEMAAAPKKEEESDTSGYNRPSKAKTK